MKPVTQAKIAATAAALKAAPLTPIRATHHARPINVDWVAPKVKESMPDPHTIQFPKHV